MRAYGAMNSDRQIKNSPIPTESQFTQFNARQIFPLYGILHVFCMFFVFFLLARDVILTRGPGGTLPQETFKYSTSDTISGSI